MAIPTLLFVWSPIFLLSFPVKSEQFQVIIACTSVVHEVIREQLGLGTALKPEILVERTENRVDSPEYGIRRGKSVIEYLVASRCKAFFYVGIQIHHGHPAPDLVTAFFDHRLPQFQYLDDVVLCFLGPQDNRIKPEDIVGQRETSGQQLPELCKFMFRGLNIGLPTANLKST